MIEPIQKIARSKATTFFPDMTKNTEANGAMKKKTNVRQYKILNKTIKTVSIIFIFLRI